MTSSPDPYWPASPDLLGDAEKCPTCFVDVSLPRCTSCGFVFTDVRALQVLETGRRIAQLEDDRRSLIEAVFTSARIADAAEALAADAAMARAATAPVAIVSAPPAVVIPPRPPLPAPASSPSSPAPAFSPSSPAPASSPSSPAPAPNPVREAAPPRAPRRRLTVPVLLLIVGVSLVSIAAIFFLMLAWFVAGIEVRALIIGGITLATIASATLLRRRRLTATAEAIAVLGVLLIALDAWAVRANDLFGTGSSDPVLYGGVAVLIVAIVCRSWSLLSGLRAPDMASVLAVPVGVALIAAGLVSLPDGQAIVVGLLGGAAGGLVHALPVPLSAARPATGEREALAWAGVVSLAAAAVAALIVAPGVVWVPVWSAPAIAGLAAAYTALARRPRLTPPPASAPAIVSVTSSIGAAVIATAGWQLALRSNDATVFSLLIAPVLAVIAAMLADALRVRAQFLRPAAIIAGTVATLGTAISLLAWTSQGLSTIAANWSIWQTDAAAGPPVDGRWLSVAASVLIALIVPHAPTLDRPWLRAARIAVGAGLVLAAAARTGIPVVLVGAAVLVAGVALWGLSRAPGPRHSRLAWGATAGAGAAIAFGAGTAAPWLWGAGAVTAIAVPLAAARIARPAPPASAALALTAIGAATLTCLVAPDALAAAAGLDRDEYAAVALLQWLALATIALGAFLPLVRAVRAAVVAAGAALLAASLTPVVLETWGAMPPYASLPVASLLGEPWTAVVRAVIGVAVLSLVALGRSRAGARLRAVTAALLAGTAIAGVSAVTAGIGADSARPLIGAAVAAAICVAGAVAILRRTPSRGARLARAGSDAGAFTVLALTFAQQPHEPEWLLLVMAAAWAAASVTAGWAAPRVRAVAGIPTAAGAGAPLALAPRRLLAWPAAAAATWALWAGLAAAPAAADLTIEAYTVAPAAALALFAGALAWLRRHRESAAAIAASFAIGLVAPAWSAGVQGARGVVVLLVAALCAGLLAWTRTRRLVPQSLAGASTALIAVLVVTVSRGWSGAPADAWWLLILVGVAYAVAAGFARGAASHGQRVFASLAPTLAVALASTTVAMTVLFADGAEARAAIAIGILLALHVAAAAVDVAPLRAASRWVAFAGAAGIGVAALGLVDAVELVSIPLALALLAAAALAIARRARAGREWPADEWLPWIAGLVLGVLPSVIAPVEGPRVWLGISAALLAAAGLALLELPEASRLRTGSAVVLALGAVAIGVHATIPADGWRGLVPLAVAGAGAVAVGAVAVWMRLDGHAVAAALLAAVGTLTPAAAIAVRGDGSLAFTVVTAVLAGVAGIAAAALLAQAEWSRFGGVAAVGSTFLAVTAIAVRFSAVADPHVFGVEPDLWAASAVGIVIAVGLSALRASASSRVAVVAGAAFAMATLLFAGAEFVLLDSGPADSAALRTLIVMGAVSAAGVAGWIERARIGSVLAWTAVAVAVVFGAAAFAAGARPLECVTVAPAAALLATGARALARTPSTRSWPALGPGLVLLTVPSLVYDLGESALWRIVALGVVTVALIVAGAVLRLQAPLVIGSAVALAHAVAQLWPWIATAYDAVPWWLWLGIGGAMLIALAARYEKNMLAFRTAIGSVTSLR